MYQLPKAFVYFGKGEISRCWKMNSILCAAVQHTVQLENIIYFLNMQIIIHLLLLCLLVILAAYTYQALKLRSALVEKQNM